MATSKAAATDCSTTTPDCCRPTGCVSPACNPKLLSATVTRDNVFFVAHLTNRPLPPLGAPDAVVRADPHRAHAFPVRRPPVRTHLLPQLRQPWRGGAAAPRNSPRISATCSRCAAASAPRAGTLLPVAVDDNAVVFGYGDWTAPAHVGDRVFAEPSTARRRFVEFALDLPPNTSDEICTSKSAYAGARPRDRVIAVLPRVRACRMRARQRRGASVRSVGPLFTSWMERSRADLALLTSELATGPYPYAGIPWFSTPFGRDAVVTSLQTLWLNPGLARGVLSFLAAHQAPTNRRS